MFGDGFAYPWVLWLLLLIPALAFVYWKRRKQMVTEVTFSSVLPFDHIPGSLREKLRDIPIGLRLLALALFLVALARPQSISNKENVSTEGIDIVLLIDISGSMLAEDFTPNRMQAAKMVAEEFIDGRSSDRIGLVIFSAESFTQCPLTTDYPVLKTLLKEVKSGMIADGTAIGLALANGVNRLKDSKAKSRVMILLTDGVNNRGEIDPITAAKIAATYGIRVYTVGVGAQGEAPYPVETPFGIQRRLIPVDLDEKTLTGVAEMTGGKYYRATDNKKLKAIYKEIDQLERTRIEVTAYKRYSEKYYTWLLLGLVALLFEVGLSSTILRKIP
ncbi:MAG: VWA domain-containing protein [Ignavibacteriales bacterium]|nr:VWA domain-containing protein [Ignavibacteriales bacterium]